jgi:hypothetical protein
LRWPAARHGAPVWGLLAALSSLSAPLAWGDAATDPAAQLPAGAPAGVLKTAPVEAAAAPTGWARWLDPATAPFLPIPLIGADPNSGTTLGLLPVKLQTDENQDIRRIIAPDLLYNPNFGYGGHARVYDYPSADEQWSLVTGINERVQRLVDAEYQDGRLRQTRLSVNASAVFARDGTPRFFGIGNETQKSAQTDYTQQQYLLQAQVGLNLTHAWQMLYTGRFQVIDVLPGTLSGIPPLQSRYGNINGVGSSSQLLHRVSIGYDTRDDVTAPARGVEWVVYAGAAARQGLFNDSMFSELGLDGRDFRPLGPDTVLATHVSLRYLPSARDVPFWALSTIGGDRNVIGGAQPLRGYGYGRYYDRDAFSATAELRRRVTSFNAVSSHVDLELAPFIDTGRVFSHAGTFPLSHLHTVGGLGIRGLARPFVVGYVDIGYGGEGVAFFTGINYPF